MAARQDVSSSSDEDASASSGSHRSKRSTPKTGCVCVTATPAATSGRGSTRLVAAAAAAAASASTPANTGNPVFGRRMMLWGRHGYHIAILPSGRVKGVEDEYSKYGINSMLEFSSAGVGQVRIKGLETDLYLAMNKDGKLYGECDKNNDATVFVEALLTQYNTYLSLKWAHLGWYVGIKKDGKIKPGPRTKWGQKAIQFLPRRKP